MSDIPKDIVVGNQNGRLSDGKSTRSKWYGKLPRPVLNAFIALVVIAMAVGGWVWYQHYQQEKQAAADKRKTQLINQAADKLDPQDGRSLESIAKQLEQQPGHNTDPNALYVLTTYYLNIGDTAKAQDYLNKLKAVYDPAKGFDESLKPITGWMTIEQLQERLERATSTKKPPVKSTGFGG